MKQLIQQAYEEAKRYGYAIEYKFNTIFVRTKYESWYFVPAFGNGKTELMHKTSTAFLRHYSGSHNEYHRQFCKKIDIPSLFLYMHEHETARYQHFTTFHVDLSKPVISCCF